MSFVTNCCLFGRQSTIQRTKYSLQKYNFSPKLSFYDTKSVDLFGRRCSLLWPYALCPCVLVCACAFLGVYFSTSVGPCSSCLSCSRHWTNTYSHGINTNSRRLSFSSSSSIRLSLSHTRARGSCLELAAEGKRPTHEVSWRLALLWAFTVIDEHTHAHTHTHTHTHSSSPPSFSQSLQFMVTVSSVYSLNTHMPVNIHTFPSD